MSRPKAPHPGRAERSSAILISVQTPDRTDDDVARSLDELAQLLVGLGITPLERVVQRQRTSASASYLGEGKLRELAERASRVGLVVADDALTPAQARVLERELGVPILDRPRVILQVFEERARTREAKLEIELARLALEVPRIRDDTSLGDKEGGGGRGGRGASNVELAKQRARERMAALRRELDDVRAQRERERATRAELFRVALVGYTNAGKSTLMRLLTGSDVLVEDKLFATLGTTVRPLRPAAPLPVLVSDTVGFLDRLPHALMASFRATLAEAREAWLQLVVVDGTDPAWREKLRVTHDVLEELGAGHVPRWLVFTRVDLLDDVARARLREEAPDAHLVCALDPADGARLRELLVAHFDESLEQEVLDLDWRGQRALAAARGSLLVVEERYDEDRLRVVVRGTRPVLDRLKKELHAID